MIYIIMGVVYINLAGVIAFVAVGLWQQWTKGNQ